MGRGYRYDSEPPTTDSVDAYNRGLQTSEATFHSTLLAHEEEKQRIKTANLALFTKLSKKQERELAQLSKDLAQSVHNFQVQQLEKLGEKYTEEELKSEKMQKKIAKRVEDFIFIEKQKNRAQEKTQEIRFQTDRKTAAMKADQEIADARRNAIEEEYKIRLKDIDTEKAKNKRALQDGKKSFKQYYKDRQKIIESENKLKQQTADKLRKDGASEFKIFIKIGIPLGKPGIMSAIILGFLEYWNLIEQPLTFLKDKSLWPLSLYLPSIGLENADVAFAASAVTLITAIIVFFAGQSYLEQGIASTAVKE